MTEENKGAAVALPEPDQEQRWYCNKCGETGVGNGFNHMRQSGFLCAYSAVTTGPFFTADQMLAFRAEGEADVRARLAAAEAEVVRLRQGLWDCFAAAGGDTDGDATPRAVVSDLVKLAVECVRETRQQDAEGLDAMRAQRDGAVAALEPLVSGHFTYFGGKAIGRDIPITRDDVVRARATLASLKEQAA